MGDRLRQPLRLAQMLGCLAVAGLTGLTQAASLANEPVSARPTPYRLSFPAIASAADRSIWSLEDPWDSDEPSGQLTAATEDGGDRMGATHGDEEDQPWRVRLPMARPRHTNLPPPPGWTAAEFASLGSSPESEPLLPGDAWTEETGRISSHKDGFFQKYSFSGAWMNRGGADNMGLTELHTFLTVAVPLPSRDFPLLITPGFDVTVLDGPVAPDLPPQVYSGYLDLMWLPKLADGWLGILSVAPGVYSDFDSVQEDAIRIKGKGLVRYDWIPDRLQLLAGVLYLNRRDVNWLPAGGVIWTPNDRLLCELLFPRPKFAHRILRSGMHEDWIYLAGEFGGDTWSIRHPSGQFDQITMRDWRVLMGVERKRPGGAGHRLEVGYVFSREVRFDSSIPDYQTDPAIIVRAAIDF